MGRKKNWNDECDPVLDQPIAILERHRDVAEVLVGRFRAHSHRFRPGGIRIVAGGLKGYTIEGSHDLFVVLKGQSQRAVRHVQSAIEAIGC